MVTKSGISNITRNLRQNNILYINASSLKDENDSRAGHLKYWWERGHINPNDSGLAKVDSFWVYVEAGEKQKNTYMFYVSYIFLKMF